jgi:hypothetical protein
MSVMMQVSEVMYPAVLRILKRHTSGMHPDQLVTAVSKLSGVSARDAKRAIWQLIARREIDFSSKQMLLPMTRDLRSGSRTNGTRLARHRSR